MNTYFLMLPPSHRWERGRKRPHVRCATTKSPTGKAQLIMPHHIDWGRRVWWKKKIVSRPWVKAWIDPPRSWASQQKSVSEPTFLWVAARKVWVVDLLGDQWGVIYCPFWRYYVMSLGCQTFFFQGLNLPPPPSHSIFSIFIPPPPWSEAPFW